MPAIFEQQQISQPDFPQRKKWDAGTLLAASQEPVAWGWQIGLTAVAIVLRAIALNQQLWFDEIMTLLDSARAPLWQIVTHYDTQNQHMLYSILAHGSIRLLGEHAWTLRLPAMCFGVACVPTLYFFGRLVTTNREALAACALMTVNYQHVWFSQNARGYTAMVFWTLLASIFFLRLANSKRKGDWLMYAVTAALGIYTHLMMVFVVAGHAAVYVWILMSQAISGRRLLRRSLAPAYGFLLCAAISVLLYAPVIPFVLSHTVGAKRDAVRYEWASPLWALAELGRGLRSTTAGGWLALGFGAVIVLCGLLSYWKQSRFLVGLIVLPALMTAAGVLATSHNFWPRFFFFEIGFALLILTRGAMVIGQLLSRSIGIVGTSQADSALIMLLLLASLVPLRAAYLYPKQDYLGAMEFVQQQRQAEEKIATVGVVSTPFQRYYGQPWPFVKKRQQLDELSAGGHAAWLLYAMPGSIRSSQPELWEAIENNFTVVRKFPGTLGGGDIYVSRRNSNQSGDLHAR
jgi:uncharacterized membrane protein